MVTEGGRGWPKVIVREGEKILPLRNFTSRIVLGKPGILFFEAKTSKIRKRGKKERKKGKKWRNDIGVENVGVRTVSTRCFFLFFFSSHPPSSSPLASVEKQHDGDPGATMFALANRFPGGQASLRPGDTDCQSICPSRWSLIRQQC